MVGSRSIGFNLTNLSEADDDVLNNQKFVNVEIISGVDFEVTTISLTPSITIPGQNLVVTAEVTNVGDLDYVGELPVRFSYDGGEFATPIIDSLASGETKTIEANYTLDANFDGIHTITAKANPDSSIGEFDLTNNSHSISIDSSGGINLSVFSLTWEGEILKGDLKTFFINVENSGKESADNVGVQVYKNVISQQALIYEGEINSMNGNSIQQLSFTHRTFHYFTILLLFLFKYSLP